MEVREQKKRYAPDDLPIEALALSTRARNALRRYRIDTVSQLLERDISTLNGVPGIGDKTADEIWLKILAFKKARKIAI